MKTVYCSGPLFSPEERAAMARIARVLERAGYETFLPHRDGIEAWVMGAAGSPLAQAPGMRRLAQLANEAVFALDVYQIVERCDALVLNLNGRVPDEGGVAETAIAFAAGKPLVIYKDDPRAEIAGSDNAMVLGLAPGFETVSDTTKIPGAIDKAIATDGESRYPANAPPRMARTLRRGRAVWRILSRMKTLAPKDRDAAAVLEELEKLDW